MVRYLFLHQVRLSMEHHKWFNIIAPTHSEAPFCFDSGLNEELTFAAPMISMFARFYIMVVKLDKARMYSQPSI